MSLRRSPYYPSKDAFESRHVTIAFVVAVACLAWLFTTSSAVAYVNPGVQVLAASQVDTEAVVDAMGTPLATGPFAVAGNYYRERAADVVFRAIQGINPTYINAAAITGEAEAAEVAAGLFPSLTSGMALSKVVATRAIPGIGTGLLLADVALGLRHWYIEKRIPQVTSGSVGGVDLLYTGATAIGQCANGGYVMTWCTIGAVPLPPDQFLIRTRLSPSGTTFTTDGLAFGVDSYVHGCRYYSPHPDEYMPAGTITMIVHDWGYYARCHDAAGNVVGSSVAAWVLPTTQLQTNRVGTTIPSGEPAIADVKITADPPPTPSTQVTNVLTQLDKPENSLLVDQINWALGNIPPPSDPKYSDPAYVPPQPDALNSPANDVYNVPNCRGKTPAGCEQLLDSYHLTQHSEQVLSYDEADMSLAPGTVVSTSPGAGTPPAPGTTIMISVNPGSPDPSTGAIVVPGCEGLSYAACADRMRWVGFSNLSHLTVEPWAYVTDAPPDHVVAVQDEGTAKDPASIEGVASNPETEPDPFPGPPIYDDDEPDDCDLPPGGSHRDLGGVQFAPVIGDPANALAPGNFVISPPLAPPGRAGLAWTVLQNGWTDEFAGTFGWGGWGYRHIDAKHGWSGDVEAQIRSTLEDPAHLVSPARDDRINYDSPIRSGVFWFHFNDGRLHLCVRRVTVAPNRIETSKPDGAPQPQDQIQTGIWTSFGLSTEVP